MNIEDVITELRNKPMSLFYGAGVSMTCGGPSGGQLFISIKRKYPKGKSDKFFDYMQEIIEFDNSNRNEIERFIKANLFSISPDVNHLYLFSLPWRAILTTNYDLLPDFIHETIDKRRFIIPLVDIDSPIDQTRQDLLYCFKLLGDVNNDYPNGGWMVLSSSDLKLAFDRRSKFFQLFRNLSSSGHIVYLGYSFEDNLVFELLQEIRFILKTIPWKSYAITQDEPSPEIHKKMEFLGITWIKGNIEEFINQARMIFGDIPSSSPSISNNFLVHNIPMTLERATSANIWRKYRILDVSLLEPFTKDPKYFFEGIDRSFYPYVAGWDFQRKTRIVWIKNPNDPLLRSFNLMQIVKQRSHSGNASDNILISLTGSAGSGKTVVANRLAFNWYQSGNPVIFIDPENIMIDTMALEGLLDEIWEKYQSSVSGVEQDKIKPLRFLIIADDCGLLLDQLITLNSHLKSIGKPADIILVSRKSDVPIERLRNPNIDLIIEIDDTIVPEERPDFIDHFQKLDVIKSIESIKVNLENPIINSSFFALIYTSVREVQKPLRELIIEEFQKLDFNSKRAYAIVSLLQSYSLTPLFSISIKSSQLDSEWLLYQIKNGSLGGVLQFAYGNQVLLTNNRVVADIISECAFRSSDEVYATLRNIVASVTIGDYTEMMLLHNLLIERVEKSFSRRLKLEHKIDLFKVAVDRIKTRPLLLHLAMLQIDSEKYMDADLTLREAFEVSTEYPYFYEPSEHVLDVKGRLELHLAENAIELGNKELAWKHLKNAENIFQQAQISPSITPHPYQGLSRTYITQANLSPDETTKWEYILLALQECIYVENYLGGEINPEITAIKVEIMYTLESINFDETKAELIHNTIGKGNGYAFLAEYEIRQKKLDKALELVQKGLEYNSASLWLIRLHVILLRKLYPNDYDTLKKALNDYVNMPAHKYDITLSFILAMETYKSGENSYAMKLFRELERRTKNHPQRLIPSEENRWLEKESPKEFRGRIINIPRYGQYGHIECSSLGYRNVSLPVRYQDIEFASQGGEKVVFNIIFNMTGPQASRVRKIAY